MTAVTYQHDLWNRHKFSIVWYGNYLKFSQHADLCKRLLASGDKILTEASPLDRVWGVGLTVYDERILGTANWTVGCTLFRPNTPGRAIFFASPQLAISANPVRIGALLKTREKWL